MYKLTSEKRKKTHCDLINQYFKKIFLLNIYSLWNYEQHMNKYIYIYIYKHTIGIVQCQVHVCNKDTEV